MKKKINLNVVSMLASLNMLPSKDKKLLLNDQLPYNLCTWMKINQNLHCILLQSKH